LKQGNAEIADSTNVSNKLSGSVIKTYLGPVNEINLTCVVQLKQRRANTRKTKKKNGQFVQRKRESNDANAEKRPHYLRLRTVVILVAFGLLLLSAGILWVNWSSPPQQPQLQQFQPHADVNVLRAAILDGLYDTEPNSTLTGSIVQCLSNAGYMVDVFRGTNVTIDLLRNVGGYKILILRLHSTIHTDGFLYFFSGEKYAESKYVNEQLAGAVRKAYTFNESEPPYFALKAVFLGNNKPDNLNGTTIILTGCNGTGTPYVIQRFFERGAKAYVSWDGYVDLSHSDEATLRLVRALYSEGLSPKEAVEEVNREVGPDPFYQSELVCNLP
jgi:hypothetical protein